MRSDIEHQPELSKAASYHIKSGTTSADVVDIHGSVFTAPQRSVRYSPYAVDWRFLPEWSLYVKDVLRHYLVQFSNYIAMKKTLSRLWVMTLGRGPMNAVDSAGILFIHVPKTGGTSISKLLYGKNLPHYTVQFWVSVFGVEPSRLQSFAVIRHPVERMISAYRMAVQGGTEIMAYSRFWRSRLRGLESLESLVDHVYDRRYNLEALPDELQEQAIFIVDNKNRIIVNRLFILDDRGRLSPQLSSWLSRYPIPHLNSTEPVVVDLTAQARNKIMEIYRRDFEIYDYVTAQGGSAEIGGRQFAPR